MINAIIQQLDGDNPEQVFLEELGDIPQPNEAFELQYGYTIQPEQGGPGITVTNTVDYNPGQEQAFNQIQNMLEQFQNVINNTNPNHINPAAPQQLYNNHGVPPDPENLPAGMTWPWNGPNLPPQGGGDGVPPQCHQM